MSHSAPQSQKSASQSQKESEMGKALLQHCGNSDLKRVTTLLGNGIEDYILNYQNNGGSNALIVSCGVNGENVALKLVNTLLGAGIETHVVNKNGMNALMMAASMGFSSVVQQLLDIGVDYSLKNKDGKTALQLTKSRAVRDAINGVIEAKAEAEKQLAITERSARLTTLLLASDLSGVRELISGNTFVEVYNVSSPRKECPFSRPIEIAVYMRLPEAVAALLEAGADPDVTHPQDDSTCVLRLCAESRAPSYPSTESARGRERVRLEMLESLISVGKASLNVPRKDSWNALMLAAAQGHLEEMNLLLTNRANPNVLEKHGDTSLILATRRGQAAAVKQLLDAKAKPDLCGAEGMTALMWAAYNNNVEIIHLLVRVNSKLNLRAKCGRTALCFAVQQKHEDAVSALVRAGSADPNLAVMVTKTPPLILAARSGHRAIVTMLLEDSVVLVKVNQQNNNAETALFWAASYGHTDIVIQLLVAGGNPYIKDREGKDAYTITKSQDVREAIKEYTLDLFKPK